jgi:hypothetical protein
MLDILPHPLDILPHPLDILPHPLDILLDILLHPLEILSNALEQLDNHVALPNQQHIRNPGNLIHSCIDMLIEVGLWPEILLLSKSLCHSVALSYRSLGAERLEKLCCFSTKCGESPLLNKQNTIVAEPHCFTSAPYIMSSFRQASLALPTRI